MADSQITFSKAQLKTRDGRSRLSTLMSQLIVQSGEAGTVLENRWKTCQDQYDATPNSSGSEITKGVQERPINIIAPRIDAAEDAIAASNIGAKPYAQCLMDKTKSNYSEPLEKGIQDICDIERFGEAYRQLVHDGLIRALGILCIAFNSATNKIEFTPIHPKCFRVFPNTNPWLDKAEFAAHQITITRAELQDLIAQKKLQKPNETDSEIVAAAQLAATTEFRAPREDFDGDSITSPFTDFDQINLWDAKIRLRVGKERSWYRVVYHEESQNVLLCEPWPYNNPGYTIGYLDLDPDRFYPNVSQAWRLVNLQHAYTEAWSMMQLGTEMEAFPPVVGTLGAGSKEITLTPGKIIPGSVAQNVQIISGRANPQIAASILPLIKSEADEVVRIARTGTAQEPVSGTTATAVQLAAEGQKRAEGSLADRASLALEHCWQRIIEICRTHPAEIAAAYPFLKDEFWVGVAQDVRVVATARSSNANPAAQMQILADLYQLAQSAPQMFDMEKIITHIVENMGIEADVNEFFAKNNTDPTNVINPAIAGQAGPGGMVPPQGDPAVPQVPQALPPADPLQVGGLQP